MRNFSRRAKLGFAAAAILGGGALATTAAAAPKATNSARQPVKPMPTNNQRALTDGVWTATTPHPVKKVGPAPSPTPITTSVHFHGDQVTVVDSGVTWVGTFNSGKVVHTKTGVDIQGHVVVSVAITPGQAPRLHPKGKLRLKVRLTASKPGLKAGMCWGPDKAGTVLPDPASVATLPAGVICRMLTYSAGPRHKVTSKAALEKAPGTKKKIKMRTRGLDWSLGR